MARTGFNAWLHETYEALEPNNQSRLSLALGPRGSGKSWSSLTLGRLLLGDKFKVEKHVCFFDGWDFAEKIQHAQKGDFMVLDDFGRGLDSREFGKASNIMISQYLETSRPKNLWLYISTPHKTFIDVRVRALCDDQLMFSERKEYEKKNNLSRCEWFFPVQDKFGTKTNPFFKKPSFIEEGHDIITDSITIPCPPSELTEVYERLRSEAVARQEVELREYFQNKGHLLNLTQVRVALRISPEDLMTMVSLNLIKLWREDKVPKVPQAEMERLSSELELRPGEVVKLLTPKMSAAFPGKIVKLGHDWALGVF